MTRPPAADTSKLHFLDHGGAAAAAIRRLDWAATPLGPAATWPAQLHTLTALMLESEQPMFITWGPEKTLLYNAAYAPLLGGKHPAALGQNFFTVWAEAAAELTPLHERVFAGDAVHGDDVAFMLDRGNGVREAHFSYSYTPIRGDDRKVIGLFCACVEITEQVLAGRQVIEARTRQQRLLQQMPGFVGVLSGPLHVFDYVNDAYVTIAGQREFIGRSLQEVFPELQDQEFHKLLDQVYASGKSFSARAFPVRLAGEAEERFIDFLYEPIRDETGAVAGVFVGGYDVTEQAKAQAELKRLNETLETVIEQRTAELWVNQALIQTFYQHSSECHAVLVADGSGYRYEEVNPATLKLYNLARAQVVGHSLHEVFGSEIAVEMGRHLAECLRTGLPHRYERTQFGSVVEAIATPVPRDKDGIQRIVVSASDVTERRQLEQQLRQSQKMEAVGQLTGGLAHDFNNLLTGISGSLELLQTRIAQGRLNDLQRYLQAGQGAARRAAALTHRLLAFSRRQTLDPRPTDVNRLIADMDELIRRTVGPEITLESVASVGLWPTLVDPNQLENALLNLCINARDAMPGGGRLTIETANRWLDDRNARERDITPGQYVSLCVTDTGSGMDADTIARAFDPFFTTKPLGEGTGLGLSMVYGFARQSAGQVRIYSELGQGTMVCIYLPRSFEKDETAGKVEEMTDLHRALHDETVLVVDDEPTVRMLVTEVLEELGYNTIEAEDGKSGLKILESGRRIDLLITDVGLPGGMNGRQLADAGRQLRPALKTLFITGYAENAVIGNGNLQPGMHVLTKPFAMDTLATRIKNIITAAA